MFRFFLTIHRQTASLFR